MAHPLSNHPTIVSFEESNYMINICYYLVISCSKCEELDVKNQFVIWRRSFGKPQIEICRRS
jgi:hypothetical protein